MKLSEQVRILLAAIRTSKSGRLLDGTLKFFFLRFASNIDLLRSLVSAF